MCDTYDDAYEMLPLLEEVISCKKAAIVAVFFIYVLYAAVAGLIYILEWKKKEELCQKFKNFKLDIEQKQLYIMVIALLTSIQTPVPFPVVMLYLYIGTIGVLLLGHLKEDKWIIKLIAYALQFLFMFILLLFTLINPWCRHYYFRNIVAMPSPNYVANSGNQ